MERPKTQTEQRKENFDKQAKIAKGLADMSLREIDQALRDEEELRQQLQVAVDFNNLTVDEADGFLEAYHRTRFGEPEEPQG